MSFSCTQFGSRFGGFVLTAVAVAAPVAAQQQDATALPNAPSHVLEQKAQQETALGRAAGSGAVYKPAGTTTGPQGLAIERATDGPLPLSLDDAIAFGLTRNVRLKYDIANQREVNGLVKETFQAFIPTMSVSASTETEEINLAAMGFKPALLSSLGSTFGFDLSHFSTIVKVDVTQAQFNLSQTLFSMPDIELYRGAKAEKAAVDLQYLNSRGEVVQAVSQAYLMLLADQANLANAQEQLKASDRVLFQASEKLKAGVGIRLDALRADVDEKQRAQAVVAAQTALAKDTIQLNRIMGLPAEQQLQLTDTAPYNDLAAMPLEEAVATAYQHRKDLLAIQANLDVEQREYRAVKYQRLPTLAFRGNYGVTGETEGLYHGTFNAAASLRVPIFNEAAQRGQQDQITAQLRALRDREASIRIDIEAQIRTAMLDVEAKQKLVEFSRSNVDLAQQELADERDRFAAGIDDNLPVIDAEASVTGAQAQLVQSLYQFNVAKLQLARATGVIESRYREYLGK